MSERYNVKNSAGKEEWLGFVDNHPNGNVFQTPQFMEFISSVENYVGVTLFASDSTNLLVGVLCGFTQSEGGGLKSFLSSRIIVWGAPLVKDNNKEVAELLIKVFVKAFSNKTIYIEFRNLNSTKEFANIFSTSNFTYKAHFNYIVRTDTEAAVKKRISKSKIRQIKSSLKKEVVIVEAANHYEIKDFYDILFNLYKGKVKKPLPKLSFFEQFYNSKQLGKIFLVKKNNKVLGGIVCPIFNNKIIYEWYVCGLDAEEKGVYPSILATYAPIEFALKNSFGYFDFMGAGAVDTDYGVREFKSKFGGELVEYGRYVRINKPLLYKLGKLGVRILGNLKRL